ncbi:MAG: hypothetical protein Q8O31_00740 [Rhodocyclaceae bacterium]|nr:hypothetical protein [Rhodocyclaceae bacterium]
MNRTGKKITIAGQPRERLHPLQDGTIKMTTFVPLQFSKRGGKKVVVGLAGVDQPVSIHAPMPAISPCQDVSLLKTLGRCYYWQHLLDSGAMADSKEIAVKEGLNKITVNETLRLAFLAPDIAQAVLEGTLVRTASRFLFLRGSLPLDWEEQRKKVARGSSA